MATIAQLNVRLGLLSKDFEKELTAFEKKMQGVATRMGDVGERMSLAFTAPLAAIGIGAIKAAGEFESLRLAMTATMESVGRGSQEAANEVAALQKVALAPGIDFEQAVKGSVRLQSVGLSAEKARLVIQELGNQIASSGGSAEQLDAVTKQFTQIIGKGRILQEDLSIILENMPSLARVLKDEFGTTSAEALRALGVSAEDFVDRLTNRMQQVPRAAGGITNSIVNAGVSIKAAAAKIGEALNSAFNVSGNLDAFAAWVTGLAERFANLEPSTQAAILSVGAFALALGPAIKGISLLFSASTTVYTAFLRVSESFKVMTAAGTGTIGVFSKLNTVMKANIFIAITSIILAAGAALYAYSSATDGVTESQRIFADAQQKVNEEVGRETAALNKNFDILKSTTATTDQRTAAVKELQKTYPDYLRNVNLEGASLTALTEIQGQLNSQILKGVAERQKAIAVEGQYNKVAQAQLRITQLRQQGFAALSGEEVKTAGRSLFGTDFEKSFVQAGARAEVVADVIKALENDVKNATKTAGELATQFDTTFGIGEKAGKKSFDALTNQRQAIEDAKDALEDMTPAQREALKFSEQWEARWAQMEKGGKDSFSGAKRSADLYKSALASINAVVEKGDVLGSDIMAEQAREIESQIERLIEGGFKPYSKEVENLRNMLKGLREDAAKGFTVQNKTQQELGISATPTALPSLDIPNQVLSIESDPAVVALNAVRDAFLEIGEASITTEAQTRIAFESYNNGAITATELFQQLANVVYENAAGLAETHAAMAEGITEFSSAIASSLESGTVSFQTFAQSATAAAAKVIGELIRIFVAKLIANSAFSTINPLAAIALAGAAGTIGSALFKRVVGAAKFAEGGVVHGPTLGLVGEYPGAANNPEIIAPENKLTSIFSKELGKSEAKLSKVVNEINTTAVQEKSSTALTNISNAISNLANSVTNNRSDVYDNSSASSTSNSVTNNTYNVFNNVTQGDSEQNTFAQTSQKLAQIKIPAFATGGVIKTPTLGLMGEYANASTNPEIIAPENKLRQIYREESAGAGGGELVAIVKGDDLQFILDRASARRSRTR